MVVMLELSLDVIGMRLCPRETIEQLEIAQGVSSEPQARYWGRTGSMAHLTYEGQGYDRHPQAKR
jgi:hypothetical protein